MIVPMNSLEHARKNMVDCQIRPNGVVSPDIIEAFETVPREAFVPKNLQNIVYCDDAVPLDDGRCLLEPVTHARMLEALAPGVNDVVLDIGGATGYSAAILSSLASTVIALEEKATDLVFAQCIWDSLDACNIVGFKGSLIKGCAKHAPFDLIFLGGSVTEIPQDLVRQLSLKGRMITIIRPPGSVMGQVTIIENLGEKGFSSYSLFEAGAAYLPGFEPQPAFTF